MRIRELFFHNIRNFRGDRLISFVDPITDETRQITVIAGSNGTGKTTILEALGSIFNLINSQYDNLANEALNDGMIGVEIELNKEEYQIGLGIQESLHYKYSNVLQTNLLQIVVGKEEFQQHPYIKNQSEYIIIPHFLPELGLTFQILHGITRNEPLLGGYLLFPHNRQIALNTQKRIEKPSKNQNWLFRYNNSENIKDNLEQFWVWQNYLDLEQNLSGSNFEPFIQRVEKALGNNRKISIKEGEVFIDTGWNQENGTPSKVRINHLPSGEQQILLLLGEISRKMRKGGVIGIDEIENSLHPTLQRLLMWHLRNLATEWDGQIIVTTHSMEIINSVRGGALINLDYPEEDHFNKMIDNTGKEIG